MIALVVDDEPLVRSELVYTLGRVAQGCTVREADSALAALTLLQEGRYDVVFLDIRLPGMDGLEAAALIDRLPRRPPIVFVTAYESHAVEAFALAATDYLLKPVTEERLAATLRRLRLAHDRGHVEPPASGRLSVDGDGRTVLVPIDDVRFVQARGHIVTVALFDQSFRYRHTLAECAARLEPRGFLRVHRAYLVNPNHVVEIHPFVAGTHALRVDDRQRSEIPVSRNFSASVRATLAL